MIGISGVVISRNEEASIARCLESLSFCDEIIVVDSGSHDRTVEIAKSITPKVFHRDWSGYAAQKNFACEKASGKWIISVDADEVVDNDLREELLRRLPKSEREVAFWVPRKTFHSGRWIRFGGWYPNRLVRVFRRDAGKWVGEDVHERWEPNGETADLNGHLLHYSFGGIADQVERNNHYSTLGAKDLLRRGEKFSLPKLVLKPVVKFFETFFLKRGFLDGLPGFMISVSAGYSVFLKWAKLWELQRDAR